MIQKRTMIFVSDQAFISKWWWIGAIRKTRLPRHLKLTTWMITRERLDDEDAADQRAAGLGAGHDREAGDARRRAPSSRCRP